jgi:hypothetical protein
VSNLKKPKYFRPALVFVLPLLFIFSECLHKTKPADPRGEKFAGSAACLKCHSKVVQSYLHSAHYLTSRTPAIDNIQGSFAPGANTVVFNDSVQVVMEKRRDGLYQASYVDGKLRRRQRFDITFGSNRGETFLYWKDNKVYQMPVTYYISLHHWGNSPGYSADSVNFNRMLGSRCFECHSSYIRKISAESVQPGEPELLDKRALVMGIDCERCHGPGAEHASFQTRNPGEKQAKYITRIGLLTRQQRIDLCSVCHAGNTNIMTRSTFDFKPGDTLANYNSGERFHAYRDVANIDVHGNQVKLLTGSKCFLSSTIECSTCHTMHNKEVKTVAVYSTYCTGCHSVAKHNFCKMAGQAGQAIYNNCIDCHMPVKASHSIVINGPGKQINPPFLARTHLIAIYPEESKKILAMLKAVDGKSK